MYVPEWKGPIEGYVVNSLSKQTWRVSSTHDRDDLRQEAYLVFLRCTARYPIIDTPQHFMSLFKTAWSRHMHDLAKKERVNHLMVPEAQLDREDETEWTRDHVGDLDNEGRLAVLIRQAPREVLLVLNLLLSAPQELLDLATASWDRRGRGAGDPEELVSRLLGLDPESRPLSAVREHFRH